MVNKVVIKRWETDFDEGHPSTNHYLLGSSLHSSKENFEGNQENYGKVYLGRGER